jgi:hypothetical protein
MRAFFTRLSWRWTSAVVLLCAIPFVLASCITEPVRVCPTPLVLKKAGELVRFAPGAPTTPENLDFQATMKVKSMKCEYVDELLTELVVNMELDITAVRGPANTSGKASFQYFVAITDVRGTVLNKQVFDLDMDLGQVGIPVTKTEGSWQKYQFLKGQTGKAYRVWMGFQLTDHDRDVLRAVKGE